MKCPCRVGKHCAVQALPDICSCRSSTHSCTKTFHWSHEMLCSIFGPGYARPHILLQFSGIVLCPSLFDERLNAVSTTEKRQSTLMKRIPFNILFRAVLSDVLSVHRFFYYSHSSSGVFLEHFGSKKSNHCVFSLFFAHHGCDNCVEGSDRNSKAKDDIACPVFDRQLLCISHRQSSFRNHERTCHIAFFSRRNGEEDT